MTNVNDNLTERIPIGDIYNLERANDDDICDRLFYEYFCPVTPHDKSAKQFIMEQYNVVAKIINNKAGFKRMIILTPSLKPEFTFDEHRHPDMKRKIYVDVKPADVKESKQDVMLTRIGFVSTKPNPAFVKQRKRKPVEKPLKKTKVSSAPSTNTRTNGKSGISAEIIALCESGKTQPEIIALGYLRNTVVPVVWKWKKSKQTKEVK